MKSVLKRVNKDLYGADFLSFYFKQLDAEDPLKQNICFEIYYSVSIIR